MIVGRMDTRQPTDHLPKIRSIAPGPEAAAYCQKLKTKGSCQRFEQVPEVDSQEAALIV
jgi:hypothetical protein